jgi:hypothetical protein
MPVNTTYLGQGRGPIGLTSSFTASAGTLAVGAAGTLEAQIAVPARLILTNKQSWVTGDLVIADPLVSNVSAGVVWNSYVSSAGTVVLRVGNLTASVVTVASSVIWSFAGFPQIP